MRYLASHERAIRGTFDFPIQLYHVDKNHSRYEMPFHWHMEHELILVQKGTLCLSVNGQPYTLREGDGILIADGSIHGGTPQECIYECIAFDLDRFLPVARRCSHSLSTLRAEGAQLECFFSAGDPNADLMQNIFQTMRTVMPGYEFITTDLLLQLLGQIIQTQLYLAGNAQTPRQQHRTEAVKNVLRRIRTSYAEPLSLEDLAREADLAPKYLCRVFRQITGRTPIDYLNYYRVECAAELMCTCEDSITDVAMRCGFDDVSYFSRVFRRLKNQSPSEYRKNHC